MKNVYFISTRLFIALFLHVFAFSAKAQTITTFAGTGVASYTGDGGPASTASFNEPDALSVDATGNIYVADYGNHCIRKISPSGIITTIAGTGVGGHTGDGGPATAAQLYHPGYVLPDGFGNIYISDEGNYIRKINAAGIISTIAGNGTATYSGDGGPASAATVNIPYGLALDGAGNLYFADRSNHRIRKINTSGVISTVAGTGVPGFTGDGVQATATEVYQPNYLCIDPSGILYFSDNGNQRIRKISSSGIISTIAGVGTIGATGDGGPATSAQLQWPAGLRFDPAGNLYIADAYNYKVRKVNVAGIISTIAGNGIMGYSGDGGPATAAELKQIFEIAFTPAGNLLALDYGNNVIREIIMENHPPMFTGGNNQHLLVCDDEGPTPINSLLAITDTDMGQTEIWSVVTSPSHGVVSASYTTMSTGGSLTPAGLSYTPSVGYVGTDMFAISVTDGVATTIVTVNVLVDHYPNAGVISGTDSVCPGNFVTLHESSTGGIWSNSNVAISTMSSTGVSSGVAPGRDTIIYTVINTCGIASAIFPFYVEDYSFCHTTENTINENSTQLSIYPNPNYGKFTISVFPDQYDENTIFITNIVGEKVYTSTAIANKPMEISLNVPAGLYFLSASASGKRYTAKILLN